MSNTDGGADAPKPSAPGAGRGLKRRKRGRRGSRPGKGGFRGNLAADKASLEDAAALPENCRSKPVPQQGDASAGADFFSCDVESSASTGRISAVGDGSAILPGLGHPKGKRSRRRARRKTRNSSVSPRPAEGEVQHRNRRAPLKNEAASVSKKQRKHPASIGQRTSKRNGGNGASPAIGASSAKVQKPKHDQHQRTRVPWRRRRPADAYAALDLGTNNCRLLVAVPRGWGEFRVIDAFSRIVRLGEGLGASGRLGDAAMERAVDALRTCAAKLGNRSVHRFRLIATEACRRAENGTEFLSRVQRETGLELEIVDRETEARLAVSGCASLLDRKAKGAVLFDIGGGSSELALLDLGRRRKRGAADQMVAWTSMPLGVVTLSEKHGGGQQVTRQVFENMVDDVSGHLNGFEGRHSLDGAAKAGEVHLLGTSGTVTTLAGVYLRLPRYDRRQVDGTWMQSADVSRMIEELLDMDFEQRMLNPCIGRDRADLVLAGCAILVAIQRMWPCERLRVADRGLREGLLTEMMHEDGVWNRRHQSHRPG